MPFHNYQKCRLVYSAMSETVINTNEFQGVFSKGTPLKSSIALPSHLSFQEFISEFLLFLLAPILL